MDRRDLLVHHRLGGYAGFRDGGADGVEALRQAPGLFQISYVIKVVTFNGRQAPRPRALALETLKNQIRTEALRLGRIEN